MNKSTNIVTKAESLSNSDSSTPPDSKQALNANLTVQFKDDQLQASWTPVELAHAYCIKVIDNAKTVVYLKTIQASGFSPPVALSSKNFSPQLGATYSVELTVQGPVSNTNFLSTPQGVQVTNAEEGKVVVTWLPVPLATGYDLKVLNQQGDELNPQPAFSPSPIKAATQVTLSGIGNSGIFQIQVRATRLNDSSEWSQPQSVTMVLTPTITSLSFQAGVVTVDWEAVANATDYEVRVLDQNGKPLSSTPTITPSPIGTANSAQINGLRPGIAYQVELRAKMADTFSAWSQAKSIAVISPPNISGIQYYNGNTNANWIAVTFLMSGNRTNTIITYDVRVLDENNNPVATNLKCSYYGDLFSVPIEGLSSGSYKVQVRTTHEKSISSWSSPYTFRFLDSPKNVSVSYVNGPEVSWSEVAQANGYNLKVLDQQWNVINPQPTLSPSPVGTATQVALSGFASGGTFKVHVQAKYRANVAGAWSAQVQLIIVEAPAISTLSFEAGVVTVDWAAVANATDYEVRVLDQNGKPLSATPTITLSPIGTANSAQISGLSPGVAYQVEIRAKMADTFCAWSQAKSIAVIAPPNITSLTYSDGIHKAHWIAVTFLMSGNRTNTIMTYDVRVLDENNNPVATNLKCDTPYGNQFSVPIEGLSSGSYKVQVRTKHEKSISSWSAQSEFSING